MLKYRKRRFCARVCIRMISPKSPIFGIIPVMKRGAMIGTSKVDEQFNSGASLALPSYHISILRPNKLLNVRNYLNLHDLFSSGSIQSRFEFIYMFSAKIGVEGSGR